MAKVDTRDFLLNTDYEMDKIIYAHDEERTVSSVTTITIPHTLPTVPLLFGIWSTSPDYTNSHELGDYDDPWNQNLRCYAKADLNNVYITLTPQSVNGSYVSTTFYVRVFGFEPERECGRFDFAFGWLFHACLSFRPNNRRKNVIIPLCQVLKFMHFSKTSLRSSNVAARSCLS